MFKKRNAIIAFLLVAVMLLGVGFAALTDSLLMTGTVAKISVAAEGDNEATEPGVDPTDPSTPQDIFDGAIGFSAVVDTPINAENKTTFTAGKVVDSVAFTASGFTKVGDTATITYTIANQHVDLGAKVSVPDEANVNPHFDVSVDWTGPQEIAAGDTKDVTVTIKLIKTPTADVAEHSFTLTYAVESVA